jgi:Ni/Fe-hydrogenase subunit HybB-like protein
VVLLLEIWLEYRADIVRMAQTTGGLKRIIYKALTLGSENISPAARIIDDKVGYAVTVIGIPSAFLLHGYVGFIFGSIKANPWWSTPLMPIVFLFSAMTSGIAAVLLLYFVSMKLKRRVIDMRCLDTIAKYLFYTFVIDFTLEMLDLIHRTYEADESFRSLDFMVHTRLFFSQIILQIGIGTLVPLALLAANQLWKFSEVRRRVMYVTACSLTMIGIFAMRWNVVIGGQLFSKSFLGYTTYKVAFAAREGLIAASGLMLLPFVIFIVLVKLLPPWAEPQGAHKL